MAGTKCNNCGATIPAQAGFCPGCGAPKPQAQPTQQYAAQPMQRASMGMQRVSPMAGLFDMAFSKTGVILGVAIGIILAWIGVIIATFSAQNGDIATFLSATGFAMMGFALIAGGVWNRRIDTRARLGMVGIGGYIITVGLVITTSIWNNIVPTGF